MNVSPRPYLTAALAGIGGEIKNHPEDFEVEEIPLYEPEGDGHHAYLWVEKCGVTGQQLISDLARHFDVPKRDIGAAGIKDKHALTRQWVSIPFFEVPTDDPAELIGEVSPRIKVLDAKLHRNKLRTGHLQGNRFRVVVRDLALPGEEALARAQAILAVLGAQGLPNYYGAQRFGIEGQTLALGVALLRGEKEAKNRVRRNRFMKRLAVSAVQSELFNRVLIARLEKGILSTALDGDVAQKTDTNGVFAIPADELAECQGRLERGEIVLTGPMPGPKMIAPERAAQEFEEGVFAASGFDLSLFEQQARLASGTRRPLLVDTGDLTVELETRDDQEVLVLGFSLPSGSYATVLLREIMKSDA
ncbi:tRNA pseudouridine(13) synthase TruD [Bradymonas sediminis]|nr:tRNA pseudouridine(13) synthase TruD [Bradymonas sediminis]TDP76435.1 tRNA pseudouridine13 synthase [Bradymonas sediminis]